MKALCAQVVTPKPSVSCLERQFTSSRLHFLRNVPKVKTFLLFKQTRAQSLFSPSRRTRLPVSWMKHDGGSYETQFVYPGWSLFVPQSFHYKPTTLCSWNGNPPGCAKEVSDSTARLTGQWSRRTKQASHLYLYSVFYNTEL